MELLQIIGGLISISSWWILALFVHPPNEKPGRQWQCTRHWCHGDADPWYAAGGVFEGQVDPRVAKLEEDSKRGSGPLGARKCDELIFGPGIYKSVREETGVPARVN